MVSVVNAVRDLRRLNEINVVLARHGFGEIVSRLGPPLGAHERSRIFPPSST